MTNDISQHHDATAQTAAEMTVRYLTTFILAAALLPGVASSLDQPVRKPPLPQTESECAARGGEWILAGPQNSTKFCFLKTADGGKACKASSQCQGECVETEKGNFCADYFSGCFLPTGRDTVTRCVN